MKILAIGLILLSFFVATWACVISSASPDFGALMVSSLAIGMAGAITMGKVIDIRIKKEVADR